jgi:hypothetical protein
MYAIVIPMISLVILTINTYYHLASQAKLCRFNMHQRNVFSDINNIVRVPETKAVQIDLQVATVTVYLSAEQWAWSKQCSFVVYCWLHGVDELENIIVLEC